VYIYGKKVSRDQPLGACTIKLLMVIIYGFS
jgi:hypothetical protein